MLSVAKLTLGQEAYYEQQVVRGLDDYYAGRGESPGIWAGQDAAELESGRLARSGQPRGDLDGSAGSPSPERGRCDG